MISAYYKLFYVYYTIYCELLQRWNMYSLLWLFPLRNAKFTYKIHVLEPSHKLNKYTNKLFFFFLYFIHNQWIEYIEHSVMMMFYFSDLTCTILIIVPQNDDPEPNTFHHASYSIYAERKKNLAISAKLRNTIIIYMETTLLFQK